MRMRPGARVIHDRRPAALPDVSPPPTVDAAALERDLRAAVRGEVRLDDGHRALYATDASNYRQVPIGVVFPRDADDVAAAVAACRRHGAPITARAGGTSLAGQACNVAVVFDFSRHMNRILKLDAEARVAVVEPGVVLDTLRDEARKHGLTFGPDPSTHNRCGLGGMIGNNSCGVHSQMAGTTADNVLELDVLTYGGQRLRAGRLGEEELDARIRAGGPEGELLARLRALRDQVEDEVRARYPGIPRRISGYNLDALLPERGFDLAKALVGTEGTCVLVLAATVRLVPWPKVRVLLVLGFPSIGEAGDAVPAVAASGCIGLEALDGTLARLAEQKGLDRGAVGRLPAGQGWLLAEYGGDSRQDAAAEARAMMERLRAGPSPPAMVLVEDAREQEDFWAVREVGLGATSRVDGQDTWEGWEDSAVPPERLGEYLRGLQQLYLQYGYRGALYGHFGQGCVHTRVSFDLGTPEGVRKFRRFLDDASDLALRLGGSLSGEHGDGQSRAELLPKMFGPELVAAFGKFKRIWDPDGKMNPGKVVDPYPITSNLRHGGEARDPATHFAFGDEHDQGSFRRAADRCLGVGLCRRLDHGTMCPSYRVTREEQHSTRGRARLLFEMLQGDVIAGWRSGPVRAALDLCLACKGCKAECPVGVDMATYKAEFLAHYYQGRPRPRSAYAMGMVFRWARLASHAPRLTNAVAGSRLTGPVVKWIGGASQERELPRLATETFRHAFQRRARPAVPAGAPRVLLWPDTFTDHFQPEVAHAAVEVLEAAGCRVEIPGRALCCGRPLYGYGWLDLARRRLEDVLDALRPEIEAGTPLVGLEPSCTAVFRDELPALLPRDPAARRLGAQTFTLAGFLARQGWRPPPLRARALVQRHCHHQAVMKFGAEQRLMEAMGLDAELLDSGCCGMAGAFGFEAEHYELSQRCGERVLFPRVRAADEGTLLLADGFSCRTQIEQATGRRALHTAELLQRALRGAQGPAR